MQDKDFTIEDIVSLRLNQNFSTTVESKKILRVMVRKPSNETFVRVHPESDYRLETMLLSLKEGGERYLIKPHLWEDLAGEPTFIPMCLFTVIDRYNNLFLWPIRLPNSDGSLDSWNKSALEIATTTATQHWIKVVANRTGGYYDCYEALACWPEPDWPNKPFKDLLNLAFQGKLIDSLDHPVLRRLRGEIQ